MANIYDYDTSVVGEQLTPPILRQTKFLAWIKVIVRPIQNFWSLVFEDYRLGSNYLAYNGSTTYNLGDRVIYLDKCIYEATSVTVLGVAQSFSGVLPTNTVFWTKVNEIFIGSDERVKYSAQKLLFEFALNKFFMVAALPADQIYITNNFINSGDVFVMDTDSELSSVMPLDSNFQEDYLDYTATYATGIYDYTIFVPTADYTALGSNAEAIIRTFADKYNIAGMQYDVVTYP
jgi:hypothetical protein